MGRLRGAAGGGISELRAGWTTENMNIDERVTYEPPEEGSVRMISPCWRLKMVVFRFIYLKEYKEGSMISSFPLEMFVCFVLLLKYKRVNVTRKFFASNDSRCVYSCMI